MLSVLDLDLKFDFDKDQIAGKRAFWLDGSTLKSVKETNGMPFDANTKKCITETVYIKVRSPSTFHITMNVDIVSLASFPFG